MVLTDAGAFIHTSLPGTSLRPIFSWVFTCLRLNTCGPAYIEGNVTDSVTGAPIANAVIRIQPTSTITFTEIDGTYAFGTPESGTFDIEFIHEDYPSKLIEDVDLGKR